MDFKCNFSLISSNTQCTDMDFKCNFSLISSNTQCIDMDFKCNFSLISSNTQGIDVHFKCNFSLITYHAWISVKITLLITYHSKKYITQVSIKKEKTES